MICIRLLIMIDDLYQIITDNNDLYQIITDNNDLYQFVIVSDLRSLLM